MRVGENDGVGVTNGGVARSGALNWAGLTCTDQTLGFQDGIMVLKEDEQCQQVIPVNATVGHWHVFRPKQHGMSRSMLNKRFHPHLKELLDMKDILDAKMRFFDCFDSLPT